MKYPARLAAAAVLLTLVFSSSVYSENDYKKTFSLNAEGTGYTVDGVGYELSGEVFLCDSTIYLPVDDLLPHCGYALGWDAENNAVIISDEYTNSYIYIDSNQINYKGEMLTFDKPTMMYNGILYMPITMFAQFSDDAVYIDGELKDIKKGVRDLLQDTYITDEYRLSGSIAQYGSIYTVGGYAAMEKLWYSDSNCKNYAGVVNAIADALPEVQIYNIAVPTITEFYGPRSLYTNQIEGIKTIYENLSDKVMPINAVKAMWEHADEKLYFYTDHHWTQRGAYYAYRAFIENKGETLPEIWEFPKNDYYSFVGSFPSYMRGTAGASAIRSHPELLERFMPVVEYTGANYHDMYLSRKLSDSQVVNPNDNSYCTFINGDQPITHYITSVKNGKKLVIVKESFGDAFATWAVNNYEEVFIVDPRKWNGFGGNWQEFNLRTFYDNVCQFDDLIIISYPGSTTSSMRQAILNLI